MSTTGVKKVASGELVNEIGVLRPSRSPLDPSTSGARWVRDDTSGAAGSSSDVLLGADMGESGADIGSGNWASGQGESSLRGSMTSSASGSFKADEMECVSSVLEKLKEEGEDRTMCSGSSSLTLMMTGSKFGL